MSFTSVSYMFFLLAAVACYYLLAAKLRLLFLCAVSFVFYLTFEPRLIFVLLTAIAIGYFGALIIEKAQYNKPIFVFFLMCSLSLLLHFKYSNFIVQQFCSLVNAFGGNFEFKKATILLPIGISYYTFVSIGYLIDVYTKELPAQRNFIKYALFVSFFPAVVQGPISRSKVILPQLEATNAWSYSGTVDALLLIAVGFFKKLAIADTVGIIVDGIFSKQGDFSGASIILSVFLFSLQLYFDFSGYTDIARGSAKLFGIELAINFKQPYFSTNFSSFWSRWHISLSSWLQDYIFTPLVWSRWCSKLPYIGKFLAAPPVLSSVMLLFLVSGIWHGVGLTFVVWGLLQGVFRVGEELLHRFFKKPKKNQKPLVKTVKIICVYTLFSFSLLFFRSPTLSYAANAINLASKTPFSLNMPSEVFSVVINDFNADKNIAVLFLIFTFTMLLIGCFTDFLCYIKNKTEVQLIKSLKKPLRWLLYYALAAVIFAAFLLQNGGFGTLNLGLYAGF